MTKSKHTATPWYIKQDIIITDNAPICLMAKQVDKDAHKNNAAFIVKAVNNHEALIDATQDAILLLNCLGHETTSAAYKKQVAEVVAALATASKE